MPDDKLNEIKNFPLNTGESNSGYICTNCGMGWSGKYIDNVHDKACPDCGGELEFRENIDKV